MPSSLARDQVFRQVAGRIGATEPPRVWSWDDAWNAISLAQADGPARLSPSAILSVFDEAVERTRRSGKLNILASAIDWPGYRRQLLGRFAAWTRGERPLGAPSPEQLTVSTEEWALFGHYRATLKDLGAEDPEGWVVWASRALVRNPPSELRKPGHVVVIDPTDLSPASWRLLEYLRKKARSMTVTLPFDPDPALPELYASIDSIRQRVLGWGFVEEQEAIGGLSFRPSGLEMIERELFRSDSYLRPRIKLREKPGLKILGGPRGEGVGLLIAREVQKLLDQGTEPEEILILVPRLDEDAERIRETLRSWGLPVDGCRSRRMTTVAAISALRLVMQLPIEHWDVSILVRLLRNGQIHWPEFDETSVFGRFEAASAIRATRVFRDRDFLSRALENAIDDPKTRNTHARTALKFLDHLSQVIDSTIGPGPWPLQVRRLQSLAQALGINSADLEPLWDALDDQGWVRQGLGAAILEEAWTWVEFAGRVEATISAIDIPISDPEPGSIRLESVEGAEGARAKVVILANLAERTFPTSEAVDFEVTGAGDLDPTDQRNLAYSREMLRFARVSAAAEDQLILAYPMTDVNGEGLLPAGFLDDVIRRLDDSSAQVCIERHPRFDPVLTGHPDLARSSTDARVYSVAQACRGLDLNSLRNLAKSRDHSEALQGSADAFEVAFRRRQEQSFGPYDGRLHDPRAIEKIREEFGPNHIFSPSQLESFALCPFQFYQRFVLGLKVVDEREELDEDYVGRGNEVHRSLEEIHQQITTEEAENIIDRLGVLIKTRMSVELEAFDARPNDVPQVLREITTRRTYQALNTYIGQFRQYRERKDEEAEPHKFEVVFGQQEDDEDTSSHPHLTIGEDVSSVRLQGKIDRIDLVRRDGRIKFRVIDYKTGSNPPAKDVKSGLASQLPLYALAVERLVFPEGDYAFHDAGYWSLPKNGFKDIKLGDWDTYRDLLMKFVLDLVSELRNGRFPVDSLKKDCHKSCDYQGVCRFGEVRMIGKIWVERPTLEGQP